MAGRPAYITIAIHSRWMGRPGRFQTLKRIVEHLKQFDDVWFATREQIARGFAEQVPYDPEEFVPGTGARKLPWNPAQYATGKHLELKEKTLTDTVVNGVTKLVNGTANLSL